MDFERLGQQLLAWLRTDAGKSALGEIGGELFHGPFWAMGLPQAIRRFLATHSTPMQPNNFAVGLAPLQLAVRNPNRLSLRIANLSNQVIYAGSSMRVTTGSAGDPEGGFPILAGSVVDLGAYTGTLWAIAGAAGADVRVLELFAT